MKCAYALALASSTTWGSAQTACIAHCCGSVTSGLAGLTMHAAYNACKVSIATVLVNATLHAELKLGTLASLTGQRRGTPGNSARSAIMTALLHALTVS